MNVRRILYVDRDMSYSATAAFANGLRGLGEVCLMESLSEEIVETVRQSLGDRPFDAIVSHLPPSRVPCRVLTTSFMAVSALASKITAYGPAFDLLEKIKMTADIPIVVYTGAGLCNVPIVSWDSSGVDDLCEKTHDPATDARRVSKMICEAWTLYSALPSAAEARCECNTGSIWIETVVRLNGGLGMCAIARIRRLLGSVDGAVALLDAGGTVARECHVNDIMEILSLEIPCGARIRICVNTTASQVKTALCRVHDLLNARYLWQVELGRSAR